MTGYAEVVPVYCFDPREFGVHALGFPRTGSHRARFLLESVAALRHSLAQAGSTLVVRSGHPVDVLPELARQWNAEVVIATSGYATEELAIEDDLKRRLAALDISLELHWQHTLVHREALPFALENLPPVFTGFRKKVEKLSPIREPLPAPERIDTPAIDDPGTLPDYADLGLTPPTPDERSVLPFTGGEEAGRKRLHHYLWDTEALSRYKYTRNGLVGAVYSSKFSPWLSLGCLSPRSIYAEIKRYEAQIVKNASTYWLVFELLWRDYFCFVALLHGHHVFLQGGIRQLKRQYLRNRPMFEQWTRGET
ncbi:MAG: DASH family cryptochrome, partial [Bacteroidota bacterium]